MEAGKSFADAGLRAEKGVRTGLSGGGDYRTGTADFIGKLISKDAASRHWAAFFVEKGLIRSILLVIVFISLFRWCRKFAGLSCDFLFL